MAKHVNFSFETIWHNLPYLIMAARWTLLISLAGMAISILWGICICAARISASRLLSGLAAVYISFFRGVPLLVQILVFYYILPYVGLDLPAIAAAIAAVGLCSAAYSAEILRGALQAIPVGQTEAAHALKEEGAREIHAGAFGSGCQKGHAGWAHRPGDGDGKRFTHQS